MLLGLPGLLQIFNSVVWCPWISIAWQLNVSVSSFLTHNCGYHNVFVFLDDSLSSMS